MLKQILTALVLLTLLILAAFWLPPTGWAVLTSAIVGFAAWEWAGLAQFGKRARLAYGLGLCACLAMFFSLLDITDAKEALLGLFISSSFVFAPLLWFVVVPLWLYFRWPLKGVRGLVIGLLVLIPPWVMGVFAFDGIYDGREPGGWRAVAVLLFISFMITITWVANIGAYFLDRKFGKHKLAPLINPEKTWEGVAGALVAVFFYLSAVPLATLGFAEGMKLLMENHFLPFIILLLCAAAVCVAACVLGNLLVSFLKRPENAKNGNPLLPSHGRVLSQVSSILALLAIWPVAFLITFFGTMA